jgi:hypothetical protein
LCVATFVNDRRSAIAAIQKHARTMAEQHATLAEANAQLKQEVDVRSPPEGDSVEFRLC